MALAINSHSSIKKPDPSKTPSKNNDTKAAVKMPSQSDSDKNKEVSLFKTPTPNSCSFRSTPKSLFSSHFQTPRSCNISKSKSTSVIPDKSANVKIKDKPFATPVSHLCSPSLSPKGRRHFIQHNKCSVKRFLSDSSLNNSMPLSSEITTVCHSAQQAGGETSNFLVGVRVRPFILRELCDVTVRNVVQMNKEEVQVTCDTGAVHSFIYDHCFWSFDKNHPQFATQETIFNTMVLPLMDDVFLGYNACLLAYGQTGSGKSYSMMGIDSGVQGELGIDSGVIPRFFLELFKRMDLILKNGGDCHVEISYFEIYNEKIHDLLRNHSINSARKTLKVREHPTFGPYVVDLSAHCVQSFKDVQDWITVGNSQRVTAATGMNEKSSRSHSIFSIMVTQKEKEGLLSCKSKVNLVDLAGSERVAQTCATGHKLKEGVSINKSLLSLGKVITFLSEKGRKKGITSFGPYRESVLTWLLKESLGGNSRTAMLATISPANIHLDETLATLRYACQARFIVNRVYKNEDANERVIRELRAEVEKIATLQAELDRMKKMMENTETKERQEEIDRLKKQLIESEQLLAKSQLSWAERLKTAENLKTAELQYLRRCGIAIELHCDKKTPCLVNLSADPILTGTLMYLLPPGRLVIGRSVESDSSKKQPDIGLSGPLIQPHHCEIENRNGRLFLTPVAGCDSYVNGRVARNEVELKHKDRVVFSGIHYFRVSIPSQAEPSPKEFVDFDFAYQEILKTQEEKLRKELEESKQKALRELGAEMKSVLGAQKFDYERQIREMLSVVEMQTNALAEERKKKNVLEVERNMLQERMKSQVDSREIIMASQNNAVTISPYRSTFITDLKKLLENRHFDKQVFLHCSNKEISLDEMQVLVQEATERCKEIGLNYKFKQQHIWKEELKPVIKIINENEAVYTLWKPETFFNFINFLRKNDQKNDVLKLFIDSTLGWETENSDAKEKRISSNTSYLKKHLNEDTPQKMFETSLSDGDQGLDTVTICLEELKSKVDFLLQTAKYSSDRWREKIKKAMKYFNMFLSVMQSEETDSPNTKNDGNDKNEKCVRFTGVP